MSGRLGAHARGVAVAAGGLLGMLLLMAGAAMPSVWASGAGVAALLASGVAWLLGGREPHPGPDREAFERDLRDTLDGYGLAGEYGDRDVDAAADAWAARDDEGGR